METNAKNIKLAIVGMDCFIDNYQTLDSLERLIYETEKTTEKSSQHTQFLTQQIFKQVLGKAKIKSDSKIGLVLISPSGNYQEPSPSISHKFTIIIQEKSILSALFSSQQLLINKEVNTVLLAEINLENETATTSSIGVIVLQLYEIAQKRNNLIYASLDVISYTKEHSDNATNPQESIIKCCQKALEIAQIEPREIGYLEVVNSGIIPLNRIEILGLIAAYQKGNETYNCAVGWVKANLGNINSKSAIFSVIKTALCLYHHYIPGVVESEINPQTEIWENSPFYLPQESRPWFLEPHVSKRTAAINIIEKDEENHTYGHLILSEEPIQIQYNSNYLQETPYYLFAIAGNNRSELLSQITSLEHKIPESFSLGKLANQTFKIFQKNQESKHILAIVARHPQELTKEIERAIQGVNIAFDHHKDWQTPSGSYFTIKPQGKIGEIAFVYPGAFTSYIGLGRKLFRLFPELHDDLIIQTGYDRVAKIEKLLYPRSISKLSRRQLEIIEQKLIDDPVSMLESEVVFARLITAILRNYFQIQSPYAFGYSLGEISMMLAQGVWTNFKNTSDYLNSSSLFKTRISGPKNTVRQYWGLPQIHNQQYTEFWSNYILLCSPEEVREILKTQSQVYITLINTPQEVIIGGETQACKKVISLLNCDAFPTSINHVIHCPPMASEYPELLKINTLPTQPSKTIFYSAYEYAPMTIDSNLVGENIAKCLCKTLDFPELVNRVYNDNIRVFIEVGVGSNCTRWIDEILKDKEHIAISLNRRGVDDYTSIIKALAKLLSHQVKLDLSPLYSHQNLIYHNQPSLVETSANTVANYRNLKSIPLHLHNFQEQHYQKLIDNHLHIAKSHAFLLHYRQTSLQRISLFLQQQLEFYKQATAEAKKIK
ncbi:type I polyketide synthase [Anabaena sp. FACHB-1237]|uniref:PfaB family protein n=1 Tax=Anabaena sp. FACHB-1237 TaxID=2692769 RepID=UPI00167FE7BF|nr:PfaB family protein [Anabaena sp. FACHB-1237]MBD2136385.1 type I polyketide synthase [Anabaena sp. FACHB-1237]